MIPRRGMCGLLVVCLLVFCLPTHAAAIEALPGSTWGVLNYSPNGIGGSGGMGWVNQGIDWFDLPGGITVNTYAEYRYRQRTHQQEYYNAQGPALGLELRKYFLRIGMDYYWERYPDYPGGVQRSHNREYYLAGYYNWDPAAAPAGRPSWIAGLPGAIWFNMTYDINGLTGSGGMGWINQGIDWFTLPGGIVFNTYAEYRYRDRTKLQEYYDARGPAVGLEFKKAFLRLGADYYWERYPKLQERSNYLEFYLSWYIDWDLMRFGQQK